MEILKLTYAGCKNSGSGKSISIPSLWFLKIWTHKQSCPAYIASRNISFLGDIKTHVVFSIQECFFLGGCFKSDTKGPPPILNVQYCDKSGRRRTHVRFQTFPLCCTLDMRLCLLVASCQHQIRMRNTTAYCPCPSMMHCRAKSRPSCQPCDKRTCGTRHVRNDPP